MVVIIERTFSMRDQIAFAELSGDLNPVHMDPIFARRSIYGQPVVHGIHLLLWALDKWFSNKGSMRQLSELKVDFNAPVILGQIVRYSVVANCKAEVKIRIDNSHVKSVQINASFLDTDDIINMPLCSHCAEQLECRLVSAKEIAFATGRTDLYLKMLSAQNLFPNLMKRLSWLQISEIIATTRIVGMLCPGLHSIYSSMNLKFSSFCDDSAVMTYRVEKYDERFSRALIAVDAPGVQGKITAFLRPPAKLQAAYRFFLHEVKRDEFLSQRAIVIGGSRGLGEVAVKLLAAGGADIRLTFYRGEKEANNIVDEITNMGGKAEAFDFDVLNPRKDLGHVLGCNWVPTHLYYFATPFIFSGSKGDFSPELFDKFCDYYVKGFLNTVEVIRGLGAIPKGIFYPSTMAIDEVVTDMGEYCAAKIAGESICRVLEKKLKNVNIIVHRLPRLATDQTASLLPVDNKDPVPIMLDILRQF